MGQRTCKRVPLDFDHPIGEIWPGYLGPELPTCTICGGEGYSPEARAISETFYAHKIGGRLARELAWHDKLGQAEVDNLIERGRLQQFVNDAAGRRWVSVPRTAAEVNEAQAGGLMANLKHDAVNRMFLIQFRCEQLGITEHCPVCDGHGRIGTPEEFEAEDNWEGTEPPGGDGWQLWETTSEGSPTSPVFESAEALADWCADNATVFADMRVRRDEWLAMFTMDTTDVGSTMTFTVPSSG